MKSSKRLAALLLCVLMLLSSVDALASDMFYVPPTKKTTDKKTEDKSTGETASEAGTEDGKGESGQSGEGQQGESGKTEDGGSGSGEGKQEGSGETGEGGKTSGEGQEDNKDGDKKDGKPATPPTELPDKIDVKKDDKQEEEKPAKPKWRWVWNRTDASWTHRVFVDENLTLLETLQRLAENSDRVLNTGAEYIIAYADRVLYPEQFEIFDCLDIPEQLCLIVAAAGHWDAVADVPFSEDAQLIYDQLVRNPRRHMQARAKYFPVKPVRIKGKLYKSFYIEIAVENGFKERDRFVFAYYQNEWRLVQIVNGEYRVVK